MKKKLLVLLFSLATLGLVSCGGGNDVASSGTSAVSAAAPSTAPSTPTTTTTAEAKVNGQIDERTGVAPVVAQFTAWSPTANGGCLQVPYFYGLNPTQLSACLYAANIAAYQSQCYALGGTWPNTAPPQGATPCQPSNFCWPCYFNGNQQ